MDVHREQELGKTYDLTLLRRLWRYVRPYRTRFILALVCLPLTSACVLAQPYLLKLAVDRYMTNHDSEGLALVGLLFAGALIGEFVFFYTQFHATMLMAQSSLADLRRDLFAHLQELPARFFERTPVGRLVTRLTTDVDAINEAFSAGTLTIFMDVLTMVGIVTIMLMLDLQLAVVTLLLVPPLLLVLNFFRVRTRRNYRVIRERLARINAFLQETISGMMVVHLFAQEKKLFSEFAQRNRDHRNANHLSNIYDATLFSLVEATSSISIALMLWYGAGQVGSGVVALGTLVAFVDYIQKLFVPMREFSSKYTTLQSALSAIERVFQLLDTPVTITSPDTPHRPQQVRGRIVFEHVWFAYNNEDWVLRDVSFTLEPGEKIALVGATGCGQNDGEQAAQSLLRRPTRTDCGRRSRCPGVGSQGPAAAHRHGPARRVPVCRRYRHQHQPGTDRYFAGSPGAGGASGACRQFYPSTAQGLCRAIIRTWLQSVRRPASAVVLCPSLGLRPGYPGYGRSDVER